MAENSQTQGAAKQKNQGNQTAGASVIGKVIYRCLESRRRESERAH